MQSVDQSRSSSRLVLPVRWENCDSSVVSGQSVDTGLNQNESELGVLVLSVSLEVLSHSDGLLDQEVEVLWELWSKTVGLQDSHNLVTGDDLGLVDSVGVSENDTDLRWGHTLSGVLDDLLHDSVWGRLEP